MNFDDAVKAHSAWKTKLSSYLKNPDGSIKYSDTQSDNKCILGQWLYGEGAKFSKLPEFATLKSEHARFHKAAAEIVKKADSGQSTSEDIALGAKSEFALASTSVVSAIMALKWKAQAAG